MTINPTWSYYFIENANPATQPFKFPEDFWELVGTEFEEIRTTNDVEVNNANAKRLYESLEALAIPYICKLHGVTPDEIEFMQFEFEEDELGRFTDDLHYVYDIEITAPTPESQAAIDEMLKAEPKLNYSGSLERFYNSTSTDEFENWQDAYERDIKSHYIEPIAKRFELDANKFVIREFDYAFD